MPLLTTVLALPATLPAAGAAPEAHFNTAGIVAIVGIAVGVLFAIAGFSIFSRHKNLTMGKAGSEAGVIAIGTVLIAIGVVVTGTTVIGLVGGFLQQIVR